ncbi:MAG: hypothetical protein K2N06_07300 [Oscillospiraceae bacterium]|nr:hypothetical protein [Oscillospiraceae bacterium]
MAEKLILNANLICKADRFVPKKCAVEKVIEVSDSEFRTFLENPMKRNYHLSAYKDLMGYYDDVYHGVLFLNKGNGDGFFVNSEGSDYARYSQFIPNARGIIRQHKQTGALEDLKIHMDCCIDRWLKKFANESKFGIPLTDLIDDGNLAEIFVDYASEMLSNDPRIETCELTHNSIEVAKRELVETRLYCPLRFEMDSDDGSGYPLEIDSANYIDFDYEINEHIRRDLCSDKDAMERGLAAYFHDENLDRKVYSVMPEVETRNGEIYGVVLVKSYGELEKSELIDLTEELTGQLSDGWGEGFEQHSVTLDGDEVYISFWSSDDDYFLKPESEVFPEQDINQGMGGIS